MNFRVLSNEMQWYADTELSIPVNNIQLSMNATVSGSYVNESTIFITEPYNVYCAADRLEPIVPDDAGVDGTEAAFVEIPEMEVTSNMAYATESVVPPPVPDSVRGEGYVNNQNASENADNGYNQEQRSEPAQIHYGFGNFGNINVGYFSTGDLLEDCDNLLRMYRSEDNVRRRENLFDDFWAKYNELKKLKPLEVLRIPSKVRGFLDVLPHFPEYQQDQIIRGVLSKNGLLADPEYISPHFIAKIFVYYEFWNYFKWFMRNLRSFRAWMFILLFTLSVTVFVYIPIAFYQGQIWRAIMLEMLLPFVFLGFVIWADTPFTARVIRRQIEEESASLGTTFGRGLYNSLLLFFCLNSVQFGEVLLVVVALLVIFWTFLMYAVVERLRLPSKYVRIATGHPTKLREKFVKCDQDGDGILNMKELRAFFESYRQEVNWWQMEIMLLQYDIHGDGGIRFDGLTIWLQKIPLDADTKRQALSSVSSYVSPSINDPELQQNKQFTAEELEHARAYGFKVQNNETPQLELAGVNAP